MSYLQYTMIGLIGVALLGILIAIIYVKWIKPIKISYTSQSFFVQQKIKKVFLSLIEESIIDRYKKNIIINDSSITSKAIKQIAIGKNIYLISDPLYYNILNIAKEKGELVAILKNKSINYTIPADIQLFLKGCRDIKKRYSKNINFEIIIPCLNKNFKDQIIDNIRFINIENLEKEIKEIENISKEERIQSMNNFEKTIVFSKKRFFINYKNEYTKKLK